MNTLIIMCGLPGCGKSTYARYLIELNPDWKYVSRDEVRYKYVSDQAHYYDHEYEVYKEFCNQISMHLINGETVIADATHLTKGSRKKLLENLSITPDKIYVVVMTTKFETCFNRNKTRVGITCVPDKSMYSMKNRYQKPNPRVETFIDKIIYAKGE